MLKALAQLAWLVNLAVPASDATSPGAPEALDPANCYALVVGVLEWQHPGFAPFAKEERQDALLAKTLIARGVPADHVTLLLDEQATRAQIETGLEKVADAATPGSTLLFYYAGHGTRGGAGGCFAPYDMSDTASGLQLERVAAIVEDHFQGERVLLFADCCYSGQLAQVVDRLGAAGFRADCISSVVAESSSTGNWTFTQTLIEGFAGDPALDRDADGWIDRSELAGAVHAAMAWRESQRSAAHAAGIDATFVLAPVAPTPEATRFRTLPRTDAAAAIALGDHVRIAEDDHAGVGRVVGRGDDDRIVVRRYDYATHEDVALAPTELTLASAETLPVDAIVGVRLGPDQVRARVLAVDAPFHRIAYVDWPDLPGEWKLAASFEPAPEPIAADRTCTVEWHGTWYPAFTIAGEAAGEDAARDDHWKIHYLGFGARWDEVVGRERIRFAHDPASPPASPNPAQQ